MVIWVIHDDIPLTLKPDRIFHTRDSKSVALPPKDATACFISSLSAASSPSLYLMYCRDASNEASLMTIDSNVLFGNTIYEFIYGFLMSTARIN